MELSEAFVAIDGPIGAGKTTLMHRLARTDGLQTEREIVLENPFLADFYADADRWAFQTEMFFLTSRYTQLRDLGPEPRGVVSDFHIRKNLLFARRTLAPAEYARLAAVFDVLTTGLPVPDVLVLLDAELPVLRRRIAQRGRGFESAIEDEYLLGLREDYRELGARMREDGQAVIMIDTSDLDIVGSDEDYMALRAGIEDAAREARSR